MGRALTIIAIVILVLAAAAAAFFVGGPVASPTDEPDSSVVASVNKEKGAHAETDAHATNSDRERVERDKSESQPAPVASQPATDLSSASLVFRGIVMDAKNKPISGAEVNALRVYGPGGAQSTRTSTDATGAFVIGLADRNGWGFRIEASAPGFATSYISELPAWLADVDLGAVILYPAVAVRGKVTNRDGAAVAGAKVYVMTVMPPADENDDEDFSSKYSPLATSSADGSFSIAQLPAGKVSIGVTANGYADLVRPGVLLGEGRPNSVEFTLSPDEPLNGTVVDEQGSGVAKAKIMLSGDQKFPFWRRPIDADANGKFTIHGLDRNRKNLNLRITKSGYSMAWHNGAQLPPDEKYKLTKAPTVLVKAEKPGTSAAKIKSVRFERRRGNNRWAGYGDVQKSQREIVEPNIWRVTASAGKMRALVTTEDGMSGASAEFEIQQNQTTPVEVAVTLDPAGSVEGRVVKSDGTPVADVRIEATPTGNRTGYVAPKVTTAGKDGSFTFDPMPAGNYSFALRSNDWIQQDLKVDVRSGEKSAGIEIRAMKPSSVTGKITIGGMPPEQPVTLAFYKIRDYENYQEWARVGMVSTGPNATYKMSPVPSGRIAVVPKRQADAEDGAIRNLEAELDHPEYDEETKKMWPWVFDVPPEGERVADLDLQAPRISYIKGLVTVNGEPRPGLDLWMYNTKGGDWKSDSTDAEGKFKFKITRAGEFNVQISGEGFGENRVVNLGEGETREVNFTLSSGGVDGSVVDASGIAVPLRVKLERQREKNTNNNGMYFWFDSPSMISKPDGSYSFPEVAAGTYRVVVSDDRRKYAKMASAPFTIGPKEKYQVSQIRVPIAAPLIIVAKTPEGKPVSGTVSVTAAPNSEPLAARVNTWVGNGSAKVNGLRPGPVVVRFMPSGPWTTEPQTISLPAGGQPTTVTFELKKREGAPNANNNNNGNVEVMNALNNIGYVSGGVTTLDGSFEFDGGFEGEIEWGGDVEEMQFLGETGGVQIISTGGGDFIINK